MRGVTWNANIGVSVAEEVAYAHDRHAAKPSNSLIPTFNSGVESSVGQPARSSASVASGGL